MNISYITAVSKIKNFSACNCSSDYLATAFEAVVDSNINDSTLVKLS